MTSPTEYKDIEQAKLDKMDIIINKLANLEATMLNWFAADEKQHDDRMKKADQLKEEKYLINC